MSALDGVLAEAWELGGNSVVFARAPGSTTRVSIATMTGPDREARAAVAALGKRALAIVLKHEWHIGYTGGTDDNGFFNESVWCVECCNDRPDGHRPDCSVGAIVAEAKRLGWTP